MDGVNYTKEELRDMHFLCGFAGGNSREAARLYQFQYPLRRQPHHSTFTRIHRALGEVGTFNRVGVHHVGRPRAVRTADFDEAVLDFVNNNPSTSTRALGHMFECSNMTAWQVLNENQMHPYHLIKVHSLLPDDFPRKVNFSQWALQRLELNPDFFKKVLFSDEACFHRDGFF